MGELSGVFSEFSGKKLPRDIDSVLSGIRSSTAWQYDPPPELLERDRLPQNEVGLLLS